MNVVMNEKKGNLDALWRALQAQFGEQGRRNEPLSAHTTLRLGGPADIWFPARSIEQLVQASTLAWHDQVPLFILGGGANLLIRDEGIRGLVIENRTNTVQFKESRVWADSGIVISRLAKQCAQHGLSGFEWAAGIPGTLGGAIVNNAGAYGKCIAGHLVQAELFYRSDPSNPDSPDGRRVWQPVNWFEYTYRTSKLKQLKGEKPIVLQAELALTAASMAEIETTMQGYTMRRKATQPPGATIGSMFKNPPGDYAGRLIEAAGLKGYRINQTQISPIHANFFVNLGGARADDVVKLIKTAQKQVYDKFRVALALEIEII